ncbi:HCL389Wp [Eremothecium sinecaudum]|uniref:HCL389Wp n=1 Tax=Eremothecium sinecaudum TaxID=45286 RepID=A0A109UZ16_9SACH|nr:HCL389Wp [Eremothecium sinecaudum]AMD19762.1 HCL389Wp [Eremothecium sinecaudum]
MSSEEEVSTFLSICGTDNADLAKQFLEMAGGNMETAISLYFEHGGESQLKQGSSNDDTGTVSAVANDEEMAQSLQREAYEEESGYRPPDPARREQLVETHFFPGQYGGIGGVFQPLRNPRDMFDDSRPAGIFNQRLPNRLEDRSDEGEYDMDDEEDDDYSYEEDSPQEHEYVEETVMEVDEEGQVHEYTKLVRKPRALTKEERMKLLFRPPFDMMSMVDLDTAKLSARKKNKWIMINIQVVDIFQCQMLNRDLWSNPEVRKIIKPNFIFLQYQYESRSAQNYVQFYDLRDRDGLPHIAILDPLTGERLKQWHREVPPVESFIKDIEMFLQEYSLDPRAANPTVKEPTPKLDPTTLSEEQQMELAIQESLGGTTHVASDNQLTKESLPLEQDNSRAARFKSIQSVSHSEPVNIPGTTTRIQIRTGNGKRLVRRFNLTDTVRTVYEVIKSEIDGFSTANFVLTTHTRENLIDKLDISIKEAGLENSSLLVEIVTDEEED